MGWSECHYGNLCQLCVSICKNSHREAKDIAIADDSPDWGQGIAITDDSQVGFNNSPSRTCFVPAKRTRWRCFGETAGMVSVGSIGQTHQRGFAWSIGSDEHDKPLRWICQVGSDEHDKPLRWICQGQTHQRGFAWSIGSDEHDKPLRWDCQVKVGIRG